MHAAEPVKIERHDVAACQHHTNTGVRAVQLYREIPGGLFVARAFDRHPRIRHWQAQLLPALGVVVCRYDFHGEREHDFYLDVATITRQGEVWTVRDHYLDILVHEGVAAEVVDTGELLAAHRADFIDVHELHHAVTTAHHVLCGLARARYDLNGWLAAQDVGVTWLDTPDYATA
jgi:predicted RNA-binding protein associated with RNAse of E/G family